jgi:hypothetical protein
MTSVIRRQVKGILRPRDSVDRRSWDSRNRGDRHSLLPSRVSAIGSLPFLSRGALGGVLAAAVLASGPHAASAADSCPNAAFRVGPSANLPDCRSYEQVTPSAKRGSNDIFLNLLSSSAPTDSAETTGGGDRALFETGSAVTSDSGGNLQHDLVFSRNVTGWTATSVTPPDAGFTQFQVGVFSPNLLHVAPFSWTGLGLDPSFSPDESLVSGAPGGPYTALATSASSDLPTVSGASADLSHIVFQSLDHSLVAAAGGLVGRSNALYESVNGQLRVVNLTTAGALTSPCGAMLGYGPAFGEAHNAVSSDGSKIFFVSPDPQALSNGASDPSCSDPQHLYMRVNGSEVVDVSAPEPGVADPDGFQRVAYVGASADGSKVFFVTKTELTADDTTHDTELYEYDTDSGALTRVSRGSSGTADGNVDWAIVSEDGSTVYFAAAGQLASGAPSISNPDVDANVYRYDTSSGTTRYIATASALDGTQTFSVPGLPHGPHGATFAAGSESNWYTTPDGKFLLFWSSANLTGYDPGTCSNPRTVGDKHCRELYRYDASSGDLECVSCPATSPAADHAEFTGEFRVAAGWSDARSPRPMSDDGTTIFFDTGDRLVRQDANGPVRDVYEWHDGQLSLISSGKDSIDARFLDSDASGTNVFFGTHAQLAPTDTDFKGDLYDARVGGGFPAPVAPQECSGDGCQGGLSPAPTTPTIGSIVFNGPGNASASSLRVKVLRKTVRGSRFALTVRVPATGRITVSGRWLRSAKRTAKKAGTYRLTITLTRRGARALRHKHRLRVKPHVRYVPGGGSPSSVTVSLTLSR